MTERKKSMDTETDRLHCMAIRHEYLRCKDALELFAEEGAIIIEHGHTHRRGYRAYNAYSSFVHHLYELHMALLARDHEVTDISKSPKIKEWMRAENEKRKNEGNKEKVGVHNYTDAQLNVQVDLQANQMLRVLRMARKSDAVDGSQQMLMRYERMLPVDQNFGAAFRLMRNKISGHVTYERIEQVKLNEFHQKYHPYLVMLYQSVGVSSLGRNLDEIPDFGEVTTFLENAFREI